MSTKERKGPSTAKFPPTKLPTSDRSRQAEEMALVGIDFTTGGIYADGVNRTRVREVPQPNLSVGGGVEKDMPPQVITGTDDDPQDEDR
jgi:hypothetical protein